MVSKMSGINSHLKSIYAHNVKWMIPPTPLWTKPIDKIFKKRIKTKLGRFLYS